MSNTELQAYSEKTGEQLIQLIEWYRHAPGGSAQELEYQRLLESASAKLLDRPDIMILVSHYLAHKLVAVNDQLPRKYKFR